MKLHKLERCNIYNTQRWAVTDEFDQIIGHVTENFEYRHLDESDHRTKVHLNWVMKFYPCHLNSDNIEELAKLMKGLPIE